MIVSTHIDLMLLAKELWRIRSCNMQKEKDKKPNQKIMCEKKTKKKHLERAMQLTRAHNPLLIFIYTTRYASYVQ